MTLSFILLCVTTHYLLFERAPMSLLKYTATCYFFFSLSLTKRLIELNTICMVICLFFYRKT